MLQLLVGAGALLDLRDSSGSTPLHLALEAQVGLGRGGSTGSRAQQAPALCPPNRVGLAGLLASFN